MLEVIPLMGVFLFQKFLVNVLVELFEGHKALPYPTCLGLSSGGGGIEPVASQTRDLVLTVFGDGL